MTATPDLLIRGVRDCLRHQGHLSTDVDKLADDADLYKAGLSSHGTVNLMLALEDAFDVEFPDAMLRRHTFESVSSIVAAVGELVRRRDGGASHG